MPAVDRLAAEAMATDDHSDPDNGALPSDPGPSGPPAASGAVATAVAEPLPGLRAASSGATTAERRAASVPSSDGSRSRSPDAGMALRSGTRLSRPRGRLSASRPRTSPSVEVLGVQRLSPP
eukprot:8682083-Alexandrium_andersonii.AAC.1